MSIYGTVEDADIYHTARLNAAWTGTDDEKTAALQRATDYIDGRYRYQTAGGCWKSMFRGVKTGARAQELEWPRTGAVDSEGNEIPDDEVPIEVQEATYEAALRELVEPGVLAPDYTGTAQVTQETVGPITVKYAEAKTNGAQTPNMPTIPVVDNLLAGLICDRPRAGVGVVVV